jgi:uncharacterized protein
MKTQALAAKNITGAIVGFVRFARAHGLRLGIEETQGALQAAEMGLLVQSFKTALRILFCTSPEERVLFDRLFDLYWTSSPVDLPDGRSRTLISNRQRKEKTSLAMMGQGKDENPTLEGKSTFGASETERLRSTDFAQVSEMDAAPLEALADRLCR